MRAHCKITFASLASDSRFARTGQPAIQPYKPSDLIFLQYLQARRLRRPDRFLRAFEPAVVSSGRTRARQGWLSPQSAGALSRSSCLSPHAETSDLVPQRLGASGPAGRDHPVLAWQ